MNIKHFDFKNCNPDQTHNLEPDPWAKKSQFAYIFVSFNCLKSKFLRSGLWIVNVIRIHNSDPVNLKNYNPDVKILNITIRLPIKVSKKARVQIRNTELDYLSLVLGDVDYAAKYILAFAQPLRLINKPEI